MLSLPCARQSAGSRALLTRVAATLQGGTCTVAINGPATTYQQCSTLDTGTDYDLYYTLDNSTGSTLLDVAISAEATNGWVGIGFPQSGQNMVGSDAVIVKSAASSPTGESSHSWASC